MLGNADFCITLNIINRHYKLAVKELSKITSTLLTTEGVRNKELITLHKFLQSGTFPKTELVELLYLLRRLHCSWQSC